MLGVVIADSQWDGDDIADIQSFRDKVTRYGTDLYEKPGNVQDNHFIQADFLGQTTIGPNDPVVVIPGMKVFGSDASELFGIAGYPVKFDPERDLWFADILLNPDSTVFKHREPFVRFGFVAFQPTSWSASGNPGDLRVSSVTVADAIQLPSTRKVLALAGGPEPTAQVFVTGASNLNTRIRVRWQTRAYQPTVWPNPLPDLCVDGESPFQVEAVPDDFDVASATIALMPGASGPFVDAMRKGRLLIEEIRTGWSLLTGGGTEDRAVFTETVDLPNLL